MSNKSQKKGRRRTKTSSFGTSGREGHDSSEFYNKQLYSGIKTEESGPYRETPLDPDLLDKIYCQSAEQMNQLPDNSIHLTVTSPPYSVGKDYDQDLSLSDYVSFLETVFQEVYRSLVSGGRACINIANLGRKPYIPLHTYIIDILDRIGFLMRGEIIWDKSASAGTSTAWGSWQSPSNPTLRDVHEYILVFSKGKFKRPRVDNKDSTISRDEFLTYTKSVWTFPTESAKRVGHPAPFPVELPYRCIQLYSYSNDIVLDPFMGSGQTALAALKTGRRFIGFDTSEEYCALANDRISRYRRELTRVKLSEFL
ncbi:MAG: DNA-methyltransferase [Candidatus Thorarchaeota archaeon]